MNQGVLYVQAAEGPVCGIVLIPDQLLADINGAVYSATQRAALQAAILPGLANLTGIPSISTMAAAIPRSIQSGATLPTLELIEATSAATWTAAQPYYLEHAEIVPICNPDVETPAPENARAHTATVYFSTSTSRAIFNPSDHLPPITTGGNQLFFPQPEFFGRHSWQIMDDQPGSAGMYWYLRSSGLYPQFAFLHTVDGCGLFNPHAGLYDHIYFNAGVTLYGLILSDQAFVTEGIYGFPVRVDAHSSFWDTCDPDQLDGLGFVRNPYPTGGSYGAIESDDPGHWQSDDPPAFVFPKQNKNKGVVPIVAALLPFLFMSFAGSSAHVGRRRRKKNKES